MNWLEFINENRKNKNYVIHKITVNITQAYEGTEIKLLRVLKSDETHCQQHDTTDEGRSLAEESKQLFSTFSICYVALPLDKD